MTHLHSLAAPKLLAAAALVAASAVPLSAQALVLTGASSAYGESVDVTVGANPITSGPMPTVSGTAPAPYSLSGSVPSVNVVNALLTGQITVNAQSNVDGLSGSRFATADSTINDLSLSVDSTNFSALAVASMATVSGDFGALTATGSTTLTNATLRGAPVASSPGPNTFLLIEPTLTIIANEQFLTTGPGFTTLQVNGLHFIFNNFFTGSGPVTGSVIFAHSDALLTAAVPEPTTWSMFGIGIVGLLAAARRRRPAANTAA